MSGQGNRQAQGSEGFPKIPAPALRALHGAGYTSLEQLIQVSEPELLNLHGMGTKAMSILREALAERGASFASRGEDQL